MIWLLVLAAFDPSAIGLHERGGSANVVVASKPYASEEECELAIRHLEEKSEGLHTIAWCIPKSDIERSNGNK
jgi:hypothetical protein